MHICWNNNGTKSILVNNLLFARQPRRRRQNKLESGSILNHNQIYYKNPEKSEKVWHTNSHTSTNGTPPTDLLHFSSIFIFFYFGFCYCYFLFFTSRTISRIYSTKYNFFLCALVSFYSLLLVDFYCCCCYYSHVYK